MTDTSSTETSLTIWRPFDAPLERVFRAFTDPDELEEWYNPGKAKTQIHTLEFEPGGRLSLTLVDRESRTDIEGTFVEIAENERLVHTWRYRGKKRVVSPTSFRTSTTGPRSSSLTRRSVRTADVLPARTSRGGRTRSRT